MRVSCLYLVNMLTLRKSEVIIVLDMFKLVELKLGLSATLHLLRCTVFLAWLNLEKYCDRCLLAGFYLKTINVF